MENPSQEFSRIDALVTNWSAFRAAHGQTHGLAEQARHDLVLRYAGVIRKYVYAIVRNETDADELSQDVMVRMLKGDFAGADPSRGRFRDFLKTVIRNMARNYWDRQNRRRPVNSAIAELDLAEVAPSDWDDVWRNELLGQVWRALQDEQARKPTGLIHTLLELRVSYPDDSSEQMAQRLGDQLGSEIRADAVRQKLRRARLRFAELLVREVAHGLQTASADEVEQELMDLKLFEQVRPLLPEDWKLCLFGGRK